jgi:cytochrome c-type biogenesis protein
MTEISYIGAFLGGILSFLSPCVLPLIPSYLSFITGVSFEDLKTSNKARVRKLTIINSAAFVTGFSTVFILLGIFSPFMSALLNASYRGIRLYHIGGIIIIVFGLYVMGVLKIRFLSAEKRVHLESKPRGIIGSFIVGLTFAAGWTPCIGPILGAILLVAGTAGSTLYGFNLLFTYSLGLAIPFMATSLTLNTFLSHYGAVQKYMNGIKIVSGLLLIAFGVILLTDSVYLLLDIAPDFGVEKLISPDF